MNNRLKLLTIALVAASGTSLPRVMGADIDVTTPISGTVNWTKDNTYVLNGLIYVLEGATLNIEAGTVIKGLQGSGVDTSALIVTRGGKINALGTKDAPIIFTAEADDVTDPEDLPLFQRGLWGGVVLLGRTTLNTAADAAGNAASPKHDVFEGLPDTQINGQFVHRYGGNDDDDNSGTLRYVSIRHAGVVFQPNKELNGLSLGAVGRGTTIEYVETYATADDGFEFFGGTVNTRHLVSAFNDDDAFDIDQGYRGKSQFWFSIQEAGKKDHGGEWNGEPNGIAVGANPIANYEIYNATFLGAGTNSTGNRALNIREFAAPKVYNSILSEFSGNAVRLDSKSGQHLNAGLLDLRDNLFWNFATNGVAVPLAETVEAEILFTDATRNNTQANPLLVSLSRTNDGKLDPRPGVGSPALTGVRPTPNDGFYTSVPYRGAFAPDSLWISGWTFLDQAGFAADVVAPPQPPKAPILKYATQNGLFILAFASESGRTYQVQSASAVTGPWTNEGNALIGTGGELTFSAPVAGDPIRAYRVIAQ